MSDLFSFCLVLIGVILYYPPVVSILPIDLSISTPFLIPSLVLIFIWYQTIRRFEFQWKLHRSQILTKIFGIFILLNLLPVCFSVYHHDSFLLWSVLLTGFLIYLVTSNYQLKVLHEPEIELEFPQRKYRNGLLWLIFILGLAQALWGFYQYFHEFEQHLNLHDFSTTDMDPRLISGLQYAFLTKRIIGTLGNPNLYATLLAMIFPVGLGLLYQVRKPLLKSFVTLGLICLSSTIVLSASRGGFIALILGIVVYLILSGKEKLLDNKSWIGIVILLSILFIIYSQTHPATGKVQTLGTRLYTGSATTHERLHYWKIAWQMIQDHPILGTGLGSYGILYGQYKPLGIGESRYAHNLFLQFWAEGGILSILVLIAFFAIILIYPLKQFPKLQRPDIKIQFAAFYSGILALLVDCFIGFGFYWMEIYFLFCILLAGLYAAINAEFVPEPSPGDILWRRQPNTPFLLITPSVTLAIILYWFFSIYPSFRGELSFQEGRLYLMTNQMNNAFQCYTRAVSYVPGNSDYQQHLGNTLFHMGQPEKGVFHLKEACELNPHTAFYHADLAIAYQRIGQLDSAVAEYKKAIACYPNKPDYHISLAQLYHQMGNNDLANQETQTADSIRSHQ